MWMHFFKNWIVSECYMINVNFKHINQVTECLLNFTQKLLNIDWKVTEINVDWKVTECWLKSDWIMTEKLMNIDWKVNYWMLTEK